MSTFYAAFPDSTKAQLMARQLMGDGIGLDDISLVTRGTTSIEGVPTPSVGDASYFVGRSDDPAHDLVSERSPEADYEAVEVSEIGGGADTSDEGTDVESVDQMDESQSVAEDQLYPRDDISNSRHETDDIDEVLTTGFPTPVTPLENAVSGIPGETNQDRFLEATPVAGLGLIMGGGDMATAAFDWAGKNGEPDAPAFLTYLQDEGVPPGTANDLLSQFGNGGAIMAVALVPAVNESALEEAAEQYGAVTSGWFGAPRY